MKYTSTLRHDADRRLFTHLEKVTNSYKAINGGLSRDALIPYIREARRVRWTFKLIGKALRLHPDTVRRIYRTWQDETYPL